MKRNNESGFVLVGTIFLMLFLMIFLGTTFMRTNIELENADLQILSLKAFQAAESGMDIAIQHLRQDSEVWRPPATCETNPLSARYPDSNFPVEDPRDGTLYGYYCLELADAGVVDGWKTVLVKSFGMDPDQTVPRVIFSQIRVENPAAALVTTQGDLRLFSGTEISDPMLANNLIFDTRNSGEKIVINDTIRIMGEMFNADSPDVIINGSIDDVGSVTFPSIQLERYRALAQAPGGEYLSGDSNTLNLSTLDSSVQVVFAEGNLQIQGSYDRSIIVVAGKDIQITGNVTASNPIDPNLPAPQIGLLAKQDVKIPSGAPSNLSIEAFIMADGAGDSKGVFHADGDVESKGTLQFKGAMAVRGGDAETAVALNVYGDRQYDFDEELSNSRTIPFLPYIADPMAGTWREGKPSETIADGMEFESPDDVINLPSPGSPGDNDGSYPTFPGMPDNPFPSRPGSPGNPFPSLPGIPDNPFQNNPGIPDFFDRDWFDGGFPSFPSWGR